MTTNRTFAITLFALAPALTVYADAAPPPPPQGVFIGKGQVGFLSSHGNSDASTLNANIDVLRYDGTWKNEIYVGGLYGKNSGIVSAERWETWGQSNYTISGDLLVFGGLRYEHDWFDGFQYQASVTGGMGYKIIDTSHTTLTAPIGAGYPRLRPATLLKKHPGEVISPSPLQPRREGIGPPHLGFSH